MTQELIIEKMTEAGVKNLKEFGYPAVNSENIFTDIIYAGFFKSMLKDNKGSSKQIDDAIDVLLAKIKTE